MRLSKTSEYAIRILCYLVNSGQELHSVKMILEKVNMPPKYMRRIMTDLCKYKFIQSVQGRYGGFSFLLPPDKIFLTDIINAVEGLDGYVGCFLGFQDCSCKNPCAVHEACIGNIHNLMNTLKKINLADLKNKKIMKF